MELKNGSLLSKFTSFLKEMGTGHEASDSALEPASEAGSHPSLRESAAVTARKHQDDAIRSREFTQLRALIQERRSQDARRSPGIPRLSNSVSPSVLEKPTEPAAEIANERVAPQVAQWWGTPPGESVPTSVPPPFGDGEGATQLSDLSALTPPTPTPPIPHIAAITANEDDFDLDFTNLLSIDDTAPGPVPAEDPADVRLRQAATCFSEGDFQGAEDHIMAALATPDLNAEAVEMLSFSLFDIYRATGQKDHFEAAALDYAQRNGRSPAEWYALPALLAALAPPQNKHKGTETYPTWKCPAQLDVNALAGFNGNTAKPDMPQTIDWSGLQRIATSAAPIICHWIRYCCKAPLTLHWSGTEALLSAISAHTQGAVAREEPVWWQMHMDLLCILQRPDDFETLALDYCVVFEVSPPSWENSPSLLVGQAPPSEITKPTATATQVLAATSGEPAVKDAIHRALSGALVGIDDPGIKALFAENAGIPFVSVSCALLLRVDGPAMEALLQWTRAMQDQGTRVSFTQVPRLILVSMLMHGLDNYATLATRAN